MNRKYMQNNGVHFFMQFVIINYLTCFGMSSNPLQDSLFFKLVSSSIISSSSCPAPFTILQKSKNSSYSTKPSLLISTLSKNSPALSFPKWPCQYLKASLRSILPDLSLSNSSNISLMIVIASSESSPLSSSFDLWLPIYTQNYEYIAKYTSKWLDDLSFGICQFIFQ